MTDINAYDDDDSPFEGFDNELTKLKNLQKSLAEQTKRKNDAYASSLQSGMGQQIKDFLKEEEHNQQIEAEKRKNPSLLDRIKFFFESITNAL